MNDPQVPPGFMKDGRGRLVPLSMIKPLEQLRDQTVREMVVKAKELNDTLTKFRAQVYADLEALVSTSAEQYNAKLGGEKGYLTLYSYDGRYKVQRSVQDLIRFDERLTVAKALIDECITTWSESSRDEIKVLVNDAFSVNKEGQVRIQQVLGLRRLAIDDPSWKRAMDAISDAVRVVGSKSYVRFYERIGDSDHYRPISLDLASL